MLEYQQLHPDMTPEVRKSIRIENPLSGAGFTSRNRAKRFVARGLAEWTEFGVAIRFLRDPRDHRESSAQDSVDQTRAAYDRAAGSGLATITELANLPCFKPMVPLSWVTGKGRRSRAR